MRITRTLVVIAGIVVTTAASGLAQVAPPPCTETGTAGAS